MPSSNELNQPAAGRDVSCPMTVAVAQRSRGCPAGLAQPRRTGRPLVRLYVVNVGANVGDASRRGLRSPIFPDGTFEFIPIKEHRDFANFGGIPRYCDLPTYTRRAESLAAYVPKRVALYRVHLDPEFSTFTYGDILSPRASNLRDVTERDQVWFLARLWNHNGPGWEQGSGFYFIGLFEVEDNIFVEAGTEPEGFPAAVRQRIQANAHYKRWAGAGDRSAFRVITGRRPGSFRFDRGLRVTPEVVAHVFGGRYEPRGGLFWVGGEILTNRNMRPRRFENFGSTTRTVQPFLDSAIVGHQEHLAWLSRLAAAHAGS